MHTIETSVRSADHTDAILAKKQTELEAAMKKAEEAKAKRIEKATAKLAKATEKLELAQLAPLTSGHNYWVTAGVAAVSATTGWLVARFL